MSMNLLNNLIKESIKLIRNRYYMLQSLQLITNLIYKYIFHPV